MKAEKDSFEGGGAYGSSEGAKEAKAATKDQLLNLAAFASPNNLYIFFLKEAKGLAAPRKGAKLQRAGPLRGRSKAKNMGEPFKLEHRKANRPLRD